MKNRIIAIVLTLVLALGSTGITQVHAADAAGQEDAPAQKEETAEQAEVIEEPVVRRVLLDDYRRTFPDKKEEYKESMRALLQKQMDALEKL